MAGGGPERGCPDLARPPPLDWPPKRREARRSDVERYPARQSPLSRCEVFYPTAASECSRAPPHSASWIASCCGGVDHGGSSGTAWGSASETRTRCPRMVAGRSALGREWAELKRCPPVPQESTWSSSELSRASFSISVKGRQKSACCSSRVEGEP